MTVWRPSWPSFFNPTVGSACQMAHFAWGNAFVLLGKLLHDYQGWRMGTVIGVIATYIVFKEFVVDFMLPEVDSWAGSLEDAFFYTLGCCVSGLLTWWLF